MANDASTTLDLIREALKDEPLSPAVSAIVDSVSARMSEAISEARRQGLYLLFIALVMELFRRSEIKEIALGPVSLNDLSAIERFLPAIGAFFIYSSIAYAITYWRLRRFLFGLNQIFRPKLVNAGYATVTFPTSPPMFGSLPHWLEAPNLWSKIGRRMTVGLRYAALTGPYVFEIFWFALLFNRYGPKDWLVWLSLLIGMFFLFYATILWMLAWRHGVVRSVFSNEASS